MQALSDALNRLLADGAWFTRAREIELLAVRVGGELRKTALQILAGLEFLPDNRSPWIVLEDAHSRADDGWTVRARRVLAHWEDRRRAFREREGIEVPAASLPGARSASSVGSFRDATAAVIAAAPAPMEAPVIVLAPTIVEDADALGAEIEILMTDAALGRCRWVWVLEAPSTWPALLKRMGPKHVVCCECVPDPAQQDKDFRALVESPPALFGRAGPRGVTRPRRVTDPPPVDFAVRDAKLRAGGIEPEYLDKAPELRSLILGAALAMKNGGGHEAVRMQREALDLATSLKLVEVAVICQIALASYLSGLDQREDALFELRAAIELAEQHQLGLQEAQARLAMALLHALDRRFSDAAREYVACARRAEAVNVPLIAIEAWRLAGQLALQLDAEPQAVSCFQEAIRVAEGAEAATVQLSSAAEAARKLAAVCRDRGLIVQASSLFEQADAMERGEVGGRAPAEPEA